MRIIIIGGGEIGYALAKALAPLHETFVIDNDPAVADRFGALDVEFILGSATSASVLRRAHVDESDFLVAATGLDEVNIVACSLAQSVGSPETFCIVSDDDLLGQAEEGDALREHFGIERIMWPEAQLAADIERVIAAPGAIDAEVFAGGEVSLLEYRLEAESPFAHHDVAALNLPHGALLVGLKREETFSIPRGATRLEPGDKVVVMGKRDAMREVQQRVNPRAHEVDAQLVTIIGGGDVGRRLAENLDRAPNITLRLIESDQARGELLAARLKHALVLHGDGTDLALLEAEQIGQSDVLVSVIDNDERNLLASLLGRQLGVRKIITRVSKPANLRLFERVGIDVALSARGAAVAAILHHIQGGKAHLLAVLEEGQGKVLELVVPAGFPPRALRDLEAPSESIVGAILRDDLAIVPRGQDVIRPGDHVLVVTTADSEDQVRDYFATQPA